MELTNYLKSKGIEKLFCSFITAEVDDGDCTYTMRRKFYFTNEDDRKNYLKNWQDAKIENSEVAIDIELGMYTIVDKEGKGYSLSCFKEYDKNIHYIKTPEF